MLWIVSSICIFQLSALSGRREGLGDFLGFELSAHFTSSLFLIFMDFSAGFFQ